jgi:hypothetical protein
LRISSSRVSSLDSWESISLAAAPSPSRVMVAVILLSFVVVRFYLGVDTYVSTICLHGLPASLSLSRER